MVYRLVPTYRFVPKSHFGMEDMKNVKLWEGVGLGLLFAVLVLSVLSYLVLKQNKLQRYAMMDNGNVKLDMKKFGLELVLPVSLGCAVVGGVLGHLYLKE
jgi:hypothetical protein